MIGTTALHTRAACDNCGEMPATREGPGGTVLCDGCGAAKPANDDAQGAFCARPLCTRCNKPAFLRVDETAVFCAECWLRVEAHLENDSISVASTPQDANATIDLGTLPASTPPVSVVATFSKEPDALALLFCRPLRRSSDITKGDRHGTELTPLEIEQRLEPVRDLESTLGGACGSERDGFGATNSRSPEPADSIDLDQNVTGGVFIPSMVAEQSWELKAGEMPFAATRAAVSPVLRVVAEPAAVEVGCGQAPDFSPAANAEESAHDVEVRIGAAGKGPRLSSPERGRAAATDTADQISSSGDGLGNQEPGSITWGSRNATPAPSGRARNRAICPAVSESGSCGGSSNLPEPRADVSSGRYDPLNWEVKGATSQSGPQDSISPSASIHPDLPRNLTAHAEGIPGAVSSFSNTPEASGTTREVPSTGCGTSSDVGTQSAPRPLFDPEFERLVSALEIEMGWRAPPASEKYDATSASFALSATASADNSKSEIRGA